MKKIIFIFAAFFFTFSFSKAQKYAYVDSEYILENIPAYKAAKAQLDELSKQWQKEIEDKYDEVEQMYKKYQAEKVLLSEEMQMKREEEIIEKEKKVKELQKQYFGREGQLFKKRQELVKPIQDEIYNAIKEISVEADYAMVFDIAAGAVVLYADTKYDISDDVLKKMGYND